MTPTPNGELPDEEAAPHEAATGPQDRHRRPSRGFFQQRYSAHKYWGRRPWYTVRALIEQHSAPGEMVLDSFCGSGTTLVEALATRRRAIGVDLNPMAVFISRVTIASADTGALERAAARLAAMVEADIAALYEADEESVEPRHWYPVVELPVSKFGVNPGRRGMQVADLFSRRNLAATALLWDAIQTIECAPPTRDLLRFTFTAALAQFTKMIRTKREGTGWWVNAYRIPRTHRENNVWDSFANKLRVVLRMKEETNSLLGPVALSTQEAPDPDASCVLRLGSATDLSFIPDESVDYVFIDPPWAIKYFDLSLLWCSWMGFPLPFEREIFPWQPQFQHDMTQALRELARVLRPGRTLTLNFASRYASLLNEWREAIEATGLEWVGTDTLQQDQLSFVQRQYDTVLKANYLLTLRKHQSGPVGPSPARAVKRDPARPVTAHELERRIRTLLQERGPLTYDAIFQALYPVLAHRRLACDLYSVLVARFGYVRADGDECQHGLWTLAEGNADPVGPAKHVDPPDRSRRRPPDEPTLPL